ncbi:MAG: ATP-binding protein [Rhodothermaceae bacterium]|nr:ATP-binding protein [Rhodothermaceae bacterium]MYE62557.1 ATP-binding protein [Rhodothermaceae bacterium]MYJ21083.1 ATP-binding protein [Rhodothermaceae bacterium]
MFKPRSSTSKELSATFDRGPAKYFHGRGDVFEKFDELTRKSEQVKGGSTFIIQGAPGVGKTALLYECEKRAEKNGWHIARIKSGALWDKEKMFRALGFWSLPQLKELSLEISLPQLVKGRVSISKPIRAETSHGSVEKRKEPLLLVLDEAQRLSKSAGLSSDRFHDACDLLESIHNGEMGKSVILLAAGLGGTRPAFRKLGISRMSKRCFVELGPLEKEAERAVIRDFIVIDGGAKGDPSEWIEAIANRTHGWPEHIVSYGEAAKDLLRKNHGKMSAEGLSVVLKYGRTGQIDYYKGRVEELRKKHRVCIANVIKDIPVGAPFDIDIIEDTLAEHFGGSEAKKLVDLINEKGVVDQRDGEHFVPIPSMHTWLVENYAIERE